MNPELSDILKEARKLLAMHDGLGLRSYPATDALLPRKGTEPEPTATASSAAPRPSTDHSRPRPTRDQLSEVQQDIAGCQLCALSGQRSHIVFGAGSPTAGLMIIGGWPNTDEDREGECYRGAEGALLVKMLGAMQLAPEEVYFTTLVKCCPSAPDRLTATETSACLPFLLRQIEAISPRVIWCLGAEAAQKLLQTKAPIIQLRGRFHELNGTPLAATFPPAMMLQNEALKKPTWLDMQMIKKKLLPSGPAGRSAPKTGQP